MDVTQEIQNNHIIYGASDYTAPGSLSASRSINYAEGPSIQRPVHRECSTVPFTFNFNSEVGLFGVENYFTKVQLKVDGERINSCYSEEGWSCATISETTDPETYWSEGAIDFEAECIVDTTYECAYLKIDSLPLLSAEAYFSIDLVNEKTGNIYNDDWLDVRLYTINREEHPYDRMWVRAKDFFYIGIHARNTRRLPFDVSCIVGLKYANYESIPNKQEIMKR